MRGRGRVARARGTTRGRGSTRGRGASRKAPAPAQSAALVASQSQQGEILKPPPVLWPVSFCYF